MAGKDQDGSNLPVFSPHAQGFDFRLLAVDSGDTVYNRAWTLPAYPHYWQRNSRMIDPATLQERITLIQDKREALVRLLEQPDLGTLRIDVNQAIEEIDDLLDEFKQTFPEASNN